MHPAVLVAWGAKAPLLLEFSIKEERSKGER